MKSSNSTCSASTHPHFPICCAARSARFGSLGNFKLVSGEAIHAYFVSSCGEVLDQWPVGECAETVSFPHTRMMLEQPSRASLRSGAFKIVQNGIRLGHTPARIYQKSSKIVC